MQEVSAIRQFSPTYNIAFVFQKLATRSLSPEVAKDFSELFREDAKSLLAILPLAIVHSENASDKNDLANATAIVSNFLEAADLLSEFSKEN